MVTFTCNDCDTTLKKKQIKTHYYRCSGSAWTCVDCLKLFVGNAVDAHTSCVTESEKYWGQFHKGNKKVKTDQPANGQGNAQAQPEPEEKKEEGPITFNGWKKTLKTILLREENNELNKKELKKKLKEILVGEGYEVEEEEFTENVDKVLGFRAFQVAKNGLVKYILPSERPPKKSAKLNPANKSK